jgi:gamma-glutamyl phosphate reductase
MKRNSELLKVLAKCEPELRKAILKAAEDDLYEAIRQCLLNVWFDTIKLKPKTAKKLAPHSKHIKFAADPRNSIEHRRRRLVQKGEGFLPFLLTSVLEKLANFL